MKKFTILLISALLLVSLMLACTPREIINLFYGNTFATPGNAAYVSYGAPYYVSDVSAMVASHGNLFLTSAGEVVFVPYYFPTDGNAWVTDSNATLQQEIVTQPTPVPVG